MFIDFFLLNPPKGVLGLDTWGDGKKKKTTGDYGSIRAGDCTCIREAW